MPIEFVTWINHHTWPISQALPEVYENEADNGSKEGEDSFYVKGYYRNGCEVIGYDDIDIRNRRSRFMSRVWPLPDTEQILGVEFLRDLPANNMIRIKGNNINFDVQFMLVPLEAEDGGHGYELNEDTWDKIVEQLGLEDEMIVVYTKKRSNKMWLTTFHIDGTPATVVNFRGAISLRTIQRQLSYAETYRVAAPSPYNSKRHLYLPIRLDTNVCTSP
ncbi:hypothetical protein Tco_0460827 [Tanacetum coccineum]